MAVFNHNMKFVFLLIRRHDLNKPMQASAKADTILAI